MLVTVGDLVDDVVVHLDGVIRRGSDAGARIVSRRGGSAANVAHTAGVLGARARFLGRVGDDAVGERLVGDLAAVGVDISHVVVGGVTSTIVVIVEPGGERSFLTDRRTASDLRDPDRSWLDAATTLHVPFYSFADEPLATSALTLCRWASAASVNVSVDLSSVAVLETFGRAPVVALLDEISPAVVFANEMEADWLGVTAAIGSATTVVKRGGAPAVVHAPGTVPREVPAVRLDDVTDTTGAGDAFAAGFLVALTGGVTDPVECAAAGHRAAATVLARLAGS